ncbi:hypothetical protein ABZ826_34005 [Streptomyces sp. NPDC047515]|uniref:hypothetical protein n=1 Tax=Streptomyces sp. NPDC047515 TaxID=3155380 RepID=UPI0033E49F88
MCIRSAGADFNDSYYDYVRDCQADGVAGPRVRHHPGFIHGPLATDDTSTSGDRTIRWEPTDDKVARVRVGVRRGKSYPGDSGVCHASDITYA